MGIFRQADSWERLARDCVYVLIKRIALVYKVPLMSLGVTSLLVDRNLLSFPAEN